MGKTFEQIMEELSQDLEGLTIDERLRLARMCVPGDPEFEVDNDGQLVLYTSAYSDDVDWDDDFHEDPDDDSEEGWSERELVE